MIKNERLFNEEDLRGLIARLFLPTIVPVYKSNTQVETTKTPFYVTVQEATSTMLGTSIKYDGENETEYSSVKSSTLFSIQIIGKNAKLWASRLQPSLRLTSVVNELKKLNVGILQISGVRDLSGAYDAGYEERAQFDVILCVEAIVKDQLNIINSVGFGLHIER